MVLPNDWLKGKTEPAKMIGIMPTAVAVAAAGGVAVVVAAAVGLVVGRLQEPVTVDPVDRAVDPSTVWLKPNELVSMAFELADFGPPVF